MSVAASVLPPPTPPPPPIAVVASMREYIKAEIRPRTEAICLAGLIDSDLAKLCIEFANALSRPASAGVLGSFMPICGELCWHSCSSASRVDSDSYETCRGAECADTKCQQFLQRECPSHTHDAIARLSESACKYVNPSPPNPPALPPSPPTAPSPPHDPPPPYSEHGVLRRAASEAPSDPDCLPVTYSACLRAVREMSDADPSVDRIGVSDELELSQALCEGTIADAASCFIGCALGDEFGVPALYTFRRASVASEFAQFNSYRCADNAEHPFCLCAAPPPPPPPSYDAVTVLSKPYAYAGQPVSGSYVAQPSGFFKAVAVDSKIPKEFASHSETIDCRGSDDGAATCTRRCASNMLGLLRAFSITAFPAPPGPPPPINPPMPPAPPPSPSPPISEFRFNGAQQTCEKNGVYRGNQCRDGGTGSVYPGIDSTVRTLRNSEVCTSLTFVLVARSILRLREPGSYNALSNPPRHGRIRTPRRGIVCVCAQVNQCGHRPDVGNGAAIGDDSCETSNNGKCEDGGVGTAYWAEDAAGNRVAVCGFATDAQDCPLRFVYYGPLTYSEARKPPTPPPPPSPSTPPPSPAPPYTFSSCGAGCNAPVCSDGGAGSLLVNKGGSVEFACNFGTQCSLCGARENELTIEMNDPAYMLNGKCDDVTAGGDAAYGTDTRDCGPMPVQHLAGPPITGIFKRRKLQAVPLPPPHSPSPPPPLPPPSLSPSPSPSTPPPPPQPPARLDMCECTCYGNDVGVEATSTEVEWDEMAINAMASVPSENTVLYSAYAVIGRGATTEVSGKAMIGDDDGPTGVYVDAPVFSSRIAHLATGWKVDADQAGAGYVDAWQMDASKGEQDCASRCVKSAHTAGKRSNIAYFQVAPSNPPPQGPPTPPQGPPTPPPTPPSPPPSPTRKPPPPPKPSKILPPPSKIRPRPPPLHPPPPPAPPLKIQPLQPKPSPPSPLPPPPPKIPAARMLSEDAAVSISLQPLQPPPLEKECRCFNAESPRLPSDADATEWISRHAQKQPEGSQVNIYAITAAWPSQLFVEEKTSVVNYHAAYLPGMSDLQSHTATFWNTANVDACMTQCAVHKFTALKRVAYDSSSKACFCSTSDVASGFVNSTNNTHFQLYSVQVCKGVRPDSTQASFAYDAQSKTWCPGRVTEDGLGMQAINGTVFLPSEEVDFAHTCAQRCTGECVRAEVMVTPWADLGVLETHLVGAIISSQLRFAARASLPCITATPSSSK